MAQTHTEYELKRVTAEDIAQAKKALAAKKKLQSSLVIREVMGHNNFITTLDALDDRLRLSPDFNEAALEALPLGIFTGVSLANFWGNTPLRGVLCTDFLIKSGGWYPMIGMMNGMVDDLAEEKPVEIKSKAFGDMNEFYKLDAKAKRTTSLPIMEGQVIARWLDENPNPKNFLGLVYSYERFDKEPHITADAFFHAVRNYAHNLKSKGNQTEKTVNTILSHLPTPRA